eukprot:463032-Pyramimonas_sp.AAC.1
MRKRRSLRSPGAWRLSACETVGQSTSNAAGCAERSSGKGSAMQMPGLPSSLRQLGVSHAAPGLC